MKPKSAELGFLFDGGLRGCYSSEWLTNGSDMEIPKCLLRFKRHCTSALGGKMPDSKLFKLPIPMPMIFAMDFLDRLWECRSCLML